MTDTKIIDRMYAFVVVDEEENAEGIPAFADERTGMWMPMVGADIARIDELRTIAEDIVATIGKEIVLYVFENRVELERYVPAPDGDSNGHG